MSNAITNKTEAMLLRRVAQTSQKVVADAIGRDTSTVSRIFSNQAGIFLSDLEGFLSSLGMQIVEHPGEMVTIPDDEYKALKILARKGLKL